MLKVAICDDDKHHANALAETLKSYGAGKPFGHCHITILSSGEALLAALDEGALFDLFLLDILMPGMDGIQLAQAIRDQGRRTPIIFLTSSVHHALDAFGVDAVQYLLKPVNKDKLFATLDTLTAAMAEDNERFYLLHMRSRAAKIPFPAIICVESYRRALRLYHENGDVLCSKTIRNRFELSVSALLEDRRFLTCHKSFVLNMQHVEALTPSTFMMKYDLRIPIPRYRYACAKEEYLTWLSEYGNGVIA